MSANALLREFAALKRHDPNRGRDGYTSKVLTLNVPAELLSRVDAALAHQAAPAPEPLALPEPLPPHEWSGDYPSGDSFAEGRVDGWNDCLDAVKASMLAAPEALAPDAATIQDLYEKHTGMFITSEKGHADIVSFARAVLATAHPAASTQPATADAALDRMAQANRDLGLSYGGSDSEGGEPA